MYLMQTVSAVPRARTAVHMDARPPYMNSTIVDQQNYVKQPLYFPKPTQEANDFKPTKKEELLNDRNIQKSVNQVIDTDAIRIENDDEEKEKKKEKKWTLGGFFRRKCKKEADESDESGDETRKGFLSRRKSKRDRRKARGKSSANGFDIIIPQQKEQINGIGKTAEELWSGSPKTNHRLENVPVNNVDNTKNVNCNGPTRYIYRHPNSPEALKSHVPRHSRRDSNLSRNSSGGSGSLDGRKGRKEVLARAEAKRDQMREESSSDENESYHSNSSLNRVNPDGTQNSRRSRISRTERHIKRLSRDDESLYLPERNVKSDLEGRRLPPHCRWISRTYYPDSSDHENLKFNLMNHSATPSPARSPRVRQKQLLQNTSSVPLPNSYPISTFPPGVHIQPARAPPNFHPNQKYVVNAKEAQLHLSQPHLNVNYSNYKPNRNSEYIQNVPRSSSEHSTNRKTLMDYEQFLSACGSNREKSLSCDQDIHRASYFENNPNEVMVVQLPIGKTNCRIIQDVPNHNKPNQSPRGARRVPPGINYYDLPQHTLRPYGNENGMIGNRIDSTSSLPVQPGNYPYQQIPIVQRSASGNSFCNLYENSKDAYYNQNRSNSYQHIPTYINQSHIYQNYKQYRMNSAVPEVTKGRYAQNGQPKSVFYWSQNETVSAKPTIINDAKDCIYMNYPPNAEPNRSPLPKPHPMNSTQNLRYYADQNPRSRNPIHITCNATPNQSPTHDQMYLSDSQVVVKHPQQRSVKEGITNASDFWKLKDQENMLKNMQQKRIPTKPLLHNRSRSSSPRPRELIKPILQKTKPNNVQTENLNRKLQKEEYNVAKLNQLISKPSNDNNLDEALNELESIYKSLHLGDEDLIERAERRDLSVFPKNPDWNKSFESDSSLHYLQLKKEDPDYQRAVPLRRSGVPDKVNDDMAYRRMNMKDKTDTKKLAPPLSYLRSSPALSPIPGSSPTLQKDNSSSQEPDITYDDVVFRNFRHANSTLKIQDPQPPFGIPIGPITPAANSDYLHITPSERFRPTFMSSKTPDVIKDDLAFRNLRKDNMTANLPVVENDSPTNELLSNPNFLLQKKRAVRSLSANLYNIMQKENSFTPIETNNNNPLEKDCEKAQSLTDLTEKQEGKVSLEKRLKELKEEKNAKRAEFFELSKEQRKKNGMKTKLSWTELANLNGDFENVPQINTSTETLTEENESKKKENNLQQKLRVNFQSEETKTPERKFRSPIVELSKYPAAAPSSTLYGNPFRESTPGSPLDESQLEDLLSALAIEAKNASEDLGRQLVELELSTAPKPKPKSRDRSVEKEKVEEPKKKSRSNSTEKSPRRRSVSRSNSMEKREEKSRSNLSRSNSMEKREEKSRSNSLEKRREKRSRNNSLEGERPRRRSSIKKEDVAELEPKIEEMSAELKEKTCAMIKEVQEVIEAKKAKAVQETKVTRSDLNNFQDVIEVKETKESQETKVTRSDFYNYKDTTEVKETREPQETKVSRSDFYNYKDVIETKETREPPQDTKIARSDFYDHKNVIEAKETREPQETKVTRSDSLRSSCSPKDRKRSVSFEVVTDLSQILQDVEEQQNLNNELSVDTDEKNKPDGKDIFQEVYEYNCKLLDLNPPKRKKSQPNEIIQVKEEVLQILESRGNNDYKEQKPNFETLVREIEATGANMLKLDDEISSDIEKEFEKLHDEVDTKDTQDSFSKNDRLVVDDLIADVTSVDDRSANDSYSPRPFPYEVDDEFPRSNGHLVSDRNGSSPSSSSGEGEAKKSSLESNVWLACSYALAFALHLQELDFLTALGIVLAVVSIIAILIL